MNAFNNEGGGIHKCHCLALGTIRFWIAGVKMKVETDIESGRSDA